MMHSVQDDETDYKIKMLQQQLRTGCETYLRTSENSSKKNQRSEEFHAVDSTYKTLIDTVDNKFSYEKKKAAVHQVKDAEKPFLSHGYKKEESARDFVGILKKKPWIVKDMCNLNSRNSICHSGRASTEFFSSRESMFGGDRASTEFFSSHESMLGGERACTEFFSSLESMLGGARASTDFINSLESMFGDKQASKEFFSSLESMLGGERASTDFINSLESMFGDKQASKEFIRSLESLLGGERASKEFFSSLEYMLGGERASTEFFRSLESMLGGETPSTEFFRSLESMLGDERANTEFFRSLESMLGDERANTEFFKSLESMLGGERANTEFISILKCMLDGERKTSTEFISSLESKLNGEISSTEFISNLKSTRLNGEMTNSLHVKNYHVSGTEHLTSVKNAYVSHDETFAKCQIRNDMFNSVVGMAAKEEEEDLKYITDKMEREKTAAGNERNEDEEECLHGNLETENTHQVIESSPDSEDKYLCQLSAICYESLLKDSKKMPMSSCFLPTPSLVYADNHVFSKLTSSDPFMLFGHNRLSVEVIRSRNHFCYCGNIFASRQTNTSLTSQPDYKMLYHSISPSLTHEMIVSADNKICNKSTFADLYLSLDLNAYKKSLPRKCESKNFLDFENSCSPKWENEENMFDCRHIHQKGIYGYSKDLDSEYDFNSMQGINEDNVSDMKDHQSRHDKADFLLGESEVDFKEVKYTDSCDDCIKMSSEKKKYTFIEEEESENRFSHQSTRKQEIENMQKQATNTEGFWVIFNENIDNENYGLEQTTVTEDQQQSDKRVLNETDWNRYSRDFKNAMLSCDSWKQHTEQNLNRDEEDELKKQTGSTQHTEQNLNRDREDELIKHTDSTQDTGHNLNREKEDELNKQADFIRDMEQNLNRDREYELIKHTDSTQDTGHNLNREKEDELNKQADFTQDMEQNLNGDREDELIKQTDSTQDTGHNLNREKEDELNKQADFTQDMEQNLNGDREDELIKQTDSTQDTEHNLNREKEDELNKQADFTQDMEQNLNGDREDELIKQTDSTQDTEHNLNREKEDELNKQADFTQDMEHNLNRDREDDELNKQIHSGQNIEQKLNRDKEDEIFIHPSWNQNADLQRDKEDGILKQRESNQDREENLNKVVERREDALSKQLFWNPNTHLNLIIENIDEVFKQRNYFQGQNQKFSGDKKDEILIHVYRNRGREQNIPEICRTIWSDQHSHSSPTRSNKNNIKMNKRLTKNAPKSIKANKRNKDLERNNSRRDTIKFHKQPILCKLKVSGRNTNQNIPKKFKREKPADQVKLYRKSLPRQQKIFKKWLHNYQAADGNGNFSHYNAICFVHEPLGKSNIRSCSGGACGYGRRGAAGLSDGSSNRNTQGDGRKSSGRESDRRNYNKGSNDDNSDDDHNFNKSYPQKSSSKTKVILKRNSESSIPVGKSIQHASQYITPERETNMSRPDDGRISVPQFLSHQPKHSPALPCFVSLSKDPVHFACQHSIHENRSCFCNSTNPPNIQHASISMDQLCTTIGEAKRRIPSSSSTFRNMNQCLSHHIHDLTISTGRGNRDVSFDSCYVCLVLSKLFIHMADHRYQECGTSCSQCAPLFNLMLRHSLICIETKRLRSGYTQADLCYMICAESQWSSQKLIRFMNDHKDKVQMFCAKILGSIADRVPWKITGEMEVAGHSDIQFSASKYRAISFSTGGTVVTTESGKQEHSQDHPKKDQSSCDITLIYQTLTRSLNVKAAIRIPVQASKDNSASHMQLNHDSNQLKSLAVPSRFVGENPHPGHSDNEDGDIATTYFFPNASVPQSGLPAPHASAWIGGCQNLKKTKFVFGIPDSLPDDSNILLGVHPTIGPCQISNSHPHETQPTVHRQRNLVKSSNNRFQKRNVKFINTNSLLGDERKRFICNRQIVPLETIEEHAEDTQSLQNLMSVGENMTLKSNIPELHLAELFDINRPHFEDSFVSEHYCVQSANSFADAHRHEYQSGVKKPLLPACTSEYLNDAKQPDPKMHKPEYFSDVRQSSSQMYKPEYLSDVRQSPSLMYTPEYLGDARQSSSLIYKPEYLSDFRQLPFLMSKPEYLSCVRQPPPPQMYKPAFFSEFSQSPSQMYKCEYLSDVRQSPLQMYKPEYFNSVRQPSSQMYKPEYLSYFRQSTSQMYKPEYLSDVKRSPSQMYKPEYLSDVRQSPSQMYKPEYLSDVRQSPSQMYKPEYLSDVRQSISQMYKSEYLSDVKRSPSQMYKPEYLSDVRQSPAQMYKPEYLSDVRQSPSQMYKPEYLSDVRQSPSQMYKPECLSDVRQSPSLMYKPENLSDVRRSPPHMYKSEYLNDVRQSPSQMYKPECLSDVRQSQSLMSRPEYLSEFRQSTPQMYKPEYLRNARNSPVHINGHKDEYEQQLPDLSIFNADLEISQTNCQLQEHNHSKSFKKSVTDIFKSEDNSHQFTSENNFDVEAPIFDVNLETSQTNIQQQEVSHSLNVKQSALKMYKSDDRIEEQDPNLTLFDMKLKKSPLNSQLQET